MVVAWIILAVAAAVGAGITALAPQPGRRLGGLRLAVAAVGALLVLLGSDLPALTWLAVAGIATLTGAVVTPGVAASADGRGRRLERCAFGLAGAVLFAVFYRVAVGADWLALPPGRFAGQTALVGAHLLTSDLVALLAVVVLLAAVAAAVRRPRRDVEGEQGGAP
jgi:hypothetical protein